MEGKGSAVAFALAALVALGATAPHLSELTRLAGVKTTAVGVGTQSTPIAKSETNQEEGDALSLLAEFFGVDPEHTTPSDRLREVRARAERENAHLRFLIATVPDPIDSYAGWQFDLALDAIQQAAADSGWALDRFYIPDTNPQSTGATTAVAGRRTHERWPGVILFRDTGDDVDHEGCVGSAAQCSELLVIFL